MREVSVLVHGWSNKALRVLLARRLAVLLVLVSFADLVTTAIALSWGAPELSPGGAAVLATAGVAGLVALKMLALLVVWLLNRGWPPVGNAVAGGLALITALAVTSNLYQLGSAGALLSG